MTRERAMTWRPQASWHLIIKALEENGGPFQSDGEWARAAGLTMGRFRRGINDPMFKEVYMEAMLRRVRSALPVVIDKSVEVARTSEGFKDRELIFKSSGLVVDRQQREVTGNASVEVWDIAKVLDAIHTGQAPAAGAGEVVDAAGVRLLGDGDGDDDG